MAVNSKDIMDRFTVGDGCWEWTGSRDMKGYGSLEIEGKKLKAHRLVYEMLTGPVPHDLELDHLCRNRCCVRPKHLEPVTHAENMRRAAPHWETKTRCPRDHPYDEANTYVSPKGVRQCRICKQITKRESRARQQRTI